MKGKEDKPSKWITDCEITLKFNLDQFQLARLVENFDLVPFDLETGRIIRFYEEPADPFVLYYGKCKFKRDEVEKSFRICNLGDEIKKLKNQRENIIFLRRERIRSDLHPSPCLDEELSKIEKDIDRLEPKFIFKKTGPSWTIVFNGIELKGLKGKGFEEIHYLVKNQSKEFHIMDLIKETEGINPEWVGNASEIIPKGDNSSKNGKCSTDQRDLIDGKSYNDLKEKRQYLKKEVEEADRNNDLARKEKAQKHLDDFNKCCSKYFNLKGKVKRTPDATTRAKARVAKRIDRALKNIKKHDKEVWKHFHNALRPIDSYSLSYSPEHHIDWLTE